MVSAMIGAGSELEHPEQLGEKVVRDSFLDKLAFGIVLKDA